jgi:type I restriction enzyme M protein
VFSVPFHPTFPDARQSGNHTPLTDIPQIGFGPVEAMIAIRGNFFYTRTVPCELWFLNKAKPKAFQDKVLMLDARGVYRKATRKIFDFSPRTVRSWSRFTLRFSTNSRAWRAIPRKTLQIPCSSR